MPKEGSYIVVQAFMIDELGLKGNELLVYAVIHGFTQDGEHWFHGTRGYLAEWCGATKGTVSNCLKSLLDKGYIRKREVERHGMTEVHYQAARNCDPLPKIDTPPAKNCDTPLPIFESIDKDNTDKDTHKDMGRFLPPTPDQVRDYAKEQGIDIDADYFCDYWESVGWMRGRVKMKDWKATARNWARRDNGRSGKRGGCGAAVQDYGDSWL